MVWIAETDKRGNQTGKTRFFFQRFKSESFLWLLI
jgi:hypothetical protein